MTTLNRSIGLFALTFYGVGVIVGAGVYSVIGAAAGITGHSLWLSFTLAAFAAILSTLSYAELSSAIPKAGAEYVYLASAFSYQAISTATGLLVAFAGAATTATVALAFAGYFKTYIEVPDLIPASALVLACTALNIIGLRESSWVNIVFTSIEILGLLLIVWAGLNSTSFGDNLLTFEMSSSAEAAAVIFFVYTGFEGLPNLVEEVKNPKRNLPRALLISMGITTLIYVLVAISVVALISPAELSKSSSPLSDAARAHSPTLKNIVGPIALFATANTALVSLLVTTRLLFGMARDGRLPKALSQVLPHRHTPWKAALLILVLVMILLPLGDVKTVASLSSFTTLFSFAAVNVALIALRFKKPQLERPFRVPLQIKNVPIPPVLGLLTIAYLLSHFDKLTYGVGTVALAMAIAIAYLSGKFKGSKSTENQITDK